jgi:hypothetical protein
VAERAEGVVVAVQREGVAAFPDPRDHLGRRVGGPQQVGHRHAPGVERGDERLLDDAARQRYVEHTAIAP